MNPNHRLDSVIQKNREKERKSIVYLFNVFSSYYLFYSLVYFLLCRLAARCGLPLLEAAMNSLS